MQWSLVYGAIAGAFELALKNERSAWSYASMTDVGRLVQATALTALSFLALIFISNRGITLPRSTLLLSWMISLFALVGLRVVWRLMTEHSIRGFVLGLKKPSSSGRRLVLVGDRAPAAAYLRRHAADQREVDYPTPPAVRWPANP